MYVNYPFRTWPWHFVYFEFSRLLFPCPRLIVLYKAPDKKQKNIERKLRELKNVEMAGKMENSEKSRKFHSSHEKNASLQSVSSSSDNEWVNRSWVDIENCAITKLFLWHKDCVCYIWRKKKKKKSNENR